MSWSVEYYEEEDTRQPAEIFEDALDRAHPRLAGKLARIAVALAEHGYQLGGGLIEPCHGYSGLWEMRAIHSQWLGREFFGFDDTRVILLHGYVKRAGQRASARDLRLASAYWTAYLQTRRVSPAQEEDHESL
jgi:hypothetical protein